MKIKYFLLIINFYISIIFSKEPENQYKSYYNKNIINSYLNDQNEIDNKINEGKEYLTSLIIYSGDLLKKIIEEGKKSNKTSPKCVEYLNDSILEEYNKCFKNGSDKIDFDNITSKIFQHKVAIEKILEFSSLKKNELSYFQGCLYQKNYSYFVVIIDTSNSITYNITNDTNNNETSETNDNATLIESNVKKKFLFYEESFYLYGFCLPYKNRSKFKKDNDDNTTGTTEKYCDTKDYEFIITMANENLHYFLFPNNSNIKILETQLKASSDALSIIILIIIILFLIIMIFNNSIFTFLIKIFTKTNQKKAEENEEEKKDINKNKSNDKKLAKLKIIHNFFLFKNNMDELFNLKTNSTEINNYSGLTEIRGLNAISIIFTLLGIIFVVIYNSPLKMAGMATMRNLFLHPVYSFVFIGLRYSPRIVFSCSGYTLAYKYLSFIEKNSENFSFFKFIFYQSHKYFLLVFFILFFRYTLSFLIIKTKKDILPNWVFFQNQIVENDKDDSDYWLSFFGINLFFEDQTKRADQKLINYFWIPFNEIYFFIIGVILLTIGYKYKLKIDIFILFLILLVFVGKIIFSYTYRDEFYSTLYYYLFDYGKFMINPLFNLTYFLIGLYFGLINFAVQKGITNQFDTSLYNKIKALTFKKNVEDEADEEDNEGEEDELINDKDNNNIEGNNDLKKDKNDNDNENNSINIEQNYIKKRNEKSINIIDLNNDERKEGTINNINTEPDELTTRLGQDMPFLIYIIKYINYRKNNTILKIKYLSFLLLLFPIALHYGMLINYHIESKIDNKRNKVKNSFNEEDIYEFFSIINLEKYITHKFTNFIFRIDIEFLVIVIHWGLFILQIRGKTTILSIFRYILWGIISKAYFSFNIISNIIILFIIYSNESIITINIYIILLYFTLNCVIIFFLQSTFYIFFEIPLKRMVKYFYDSDNEQYKEEEDENENNEDNIVNEKNNRRVYAINNVSQNDESIDIEKKEDDNENNLFI